MHRRALLSAAGVALSAGVAGCLDVGGGESPDAAESGDAVAGAGDDAGGDAGPELPEFPMVEDPPPAVYVPTHREAMIMPGPAEAGEIVVGPMITTPHPFWLVSGDEVQFVEVLDSDDVHLMVTRWDRETGTVVPGMGGVTFELRRDGRVVDTRSPWPMISQTMGAHLGDNVPLDGYGTYEVEVSIPPVAIRKTGALAGRLGTRETATFEFTYDRAFLERMVDGIAWIEEDQWGVRGAIAPDYGHDSGENEGHDGGSHDHGEIPFSTLPRVEDLPGRTLGTPISGDADLAVNLVEEGRFVEDDPYLLVSPRTPYNRVPLSEMVLSVQVRRDGETVAERTLVETLDDRAGHHYGIEVPEVEPGDVLTLVVKTPPHTARHQGYETAFLDMPPVEVTVGESE